MYGGFNIARRIRALERASPALPKKRRKSPHVREEPAGPELVRGRGRTRGRLRPFRALRWLWYAAVAAAILLFVLRVWVVPLLPPAN